MLGEGTDRAGHALQIDMQARNERRGVLVDDHLMMIAHRYAGRNGAWGANPP